MIAFHSDAVLGNVTEEKMVLGHQSWEQQLGIFGSIAILGYLRQVGLEAPVDAEVSRCSSLSCEIV